MLSQGDPPRSSLLQVLSDPGSFTILPLTSLVGTRILHDPHAYKSCQTPDPPRSSRLQVLSDLGSSTFHPLTSLVRPRILHDPHAYKSRREAHRRHAASARR